MNGLQAIARKAGKRLRGPAWYAWNILRACWMFYLRDLAERPGQTCIKRTAYRLVITIESLLEAVFLFLMIQIVGTVASIALPLRWAFMELRETWFPPDWKKA